MPNIAPHLLLGVSLFLVGCGSNMPDMSHPPLSRAEQGEEIKVIKSTRGYWALSQVKGMDKLPADASITLHPFNVADRTQLRIHGSSGVNYYSGGGKADWLRGRLQIYGLSRTRQAGKTDDLQLERQIIAQLERVVQFEIKDQQLVLTTLAGNTLSFKREE